MSYEYPATAAERKAAALLRKKGWNVAAPACPDCKGAGTIYGWSTWSTGGGTSVSSGSKPCPRGCPSTMMFYSSFNTTTTVADGTVGMRRGE